MPFFRKLSNSTRTYRAAVAGAPGVFFAAQNTGGTIWRSTDGGNTWSSYLTSLGFNPRELAYANGYLYVFDNNLGVQVYSGASTSTPTMTRSRSSSGLNGYFSYQCAVDPTGQYAMLASDFGYWNYTTNYGVNWSNVKPASNNIYPCLYGNGKFVTATITDGRSYTMSTSSMGSYTSGGIVSTSVNTSGGYDGVNNVYWISPNGVAKVWYSTDGSSWTERSGLPLTPGDIAAYSGKIIISANSGYSPTQTSYSTDIGATWSTPVARDGTVRNSAGILANYQSNFILATNTGLYYSGDGITWAQKQSGDFSVVCGGI